MSPRLILYRKNGACSFAAHALLNELGISFTAVELIMGQDGMTSADGSFTNSEYKHIHPDGYVPALSIDGYILTELPAVLEYVAALQPSPDLRGDTPLQKAQVLQWLAWLSGKLHAQGFAMLWRQQRFSSDSNAYGSIKSQGEKVILDCAERINREIQGAHAVGNEFTLVDLALYTFYRWISLFVLPNGRAHAQFPRYAELARHAERRESVRTTLSIEDQRLLFRT